MATKKRVMVVLTDEMHSALNRQAAQRGATLSGLVRAVLGEWLLTQGEDVEWIIEWGGRRKRDDQTSEE